MIFSDDSAIWQPHYNSLAVNVLQKYEYKTLWDMQIKKQELMLLKDFLKKFIKYMATGPNTGNSLPYFKLLHITENLCKTNR